MVVYAPGTQERDPSKQNMALQHHAGLIDTNTAGIASNAAAITALQTAGTGLVNSGGSLAVSLSKITASLGADVALNNIANYFDGPSIAQGTSGTWLVTGQVTVMDTAGACSFFAKLWDGTTVIASGFTTTPAANFGVLIPLAGYLSSPAGNLRISVRDPSTTTGKIVFNTTGNSKDSTISAIRIA